MSDDIVNRLRTWLYETPVCMEAADEIERLTAWNERLLAALEEICKVQNTYRSREQELAAMCLNQQSTLQES